MLEKLPRAGDFYGSDTVELPVMRLAVKGVGVLGFVVSGRMTSSLLRIELVDRDVEGVAVGCRTCEAPRPIMARKVWMYAPDSGGVKIPDKTKAEVRRRLEAYAAKHYAGRYTRLDLRFRGPFCYVDAFREPDVSGPLHGESAAERLERLRNTPTHLCRLRHFAPDRWTLGFYKYSDEKYELCFVDEADGFECTPEQGFAVAANVYLGSG